MAIPNSEHQQYSVINAVSSLLSITLQSAILCKAYTLSKLELVLVFKLSNSAFFTIKVEQQYQTCFLWFDHKLPPNISNAQPCFNSVVGLPIVKIEQHANNRSFAIHFLNQYILLFKCYDALANVLLFGNNGVEEMFRKNRSNDLELLITNFEPETIKANLLPQIFYVYKRPQHIHPYYVTSRLQNDDLAFQSANIFEVLNYFNSNALNYYHFNSLKQQLLLAARTQLKKYNATVNSIQLAINPVSGAITAEEIANILMANLHAIPLQTTQITLPDFYRNKEVTITLKKELNAQQNAAYYYRKHKNSKQQMDMLQSKLHKVTQHIIQVNQQILAIENAEHTKALKPFMPKERKAQLTVFPFKQFEHEEFLIWVGKSAANNDELTLKHSHKNDLWLHAKDVTGSHVLVKWKPGKEFTKSVIERAAQLAAFYSKLKGSNLVSVTYTLKKYVRKPKGYEPGQVAVDKEEVILVQPKLE